MVTTRTARTVLAISLGIVLAVCAQVEQPALAPQAGPEEDLPLPPERPSRPRI